MKFGKYKIDDIYILMIIFGLIFSFFVPLMLFQVIIALFIGIEKIEK
ncbi:hypothetical protein [Staphylococcus caeli]|uniref:Uncharacterized protein n=1 Tax=Staphylococcus caeli TaxID=2201815 RepID=A0A1D4PP83_9STAP|nr:hypothetical protein [Staphylococcus caeli]SCT02739.1 Uncharacterised protein [Staphylococcus caeli]SCT24748.1 Uncharacterised protein [Staphylococcus caeli]